MSTENQEVKKNLHVVWENLHNGTRFMTSFTEGKVYEDNEHHKVIGKELNYDDALVLCKVTESKNIASFLNKMPDELRSYKMDTLIAGMIRNAK